MYELVKVVHKRTSCYFTPMSCSMGCGCYEFCRCAKLL